MSLCEQCVKTKGTCCNQREIFLTLGDIERIRNFLHSEDFYEYRVPVNPAYLDQPDDPYWNLFTVEADSTRRVLKNQKSGLCSMVTPTGCILPMNVRPLICRLHPIMYNHERITGIEPDCPAEYLPEGQTVLEALGMDTVTGEEWRQQLYNELAGEKPDIMPQHMPRQMPAEKKSQN